jgi:hypothetical protein
MFISNQNLAVKYRMPSVLNSIDQFPQNFMHDGKLKTILVVEKKAILLNLLLLKWTATCKGLPQLSLLGANDCLSLDLG